MGGGGARARWRSDERGQATVEFALVLPLALTLLLAIVQAGVLVRDQVAVVHAAREAARAAAVDPNPGRAQAAARAVLAEAQVDVGPRGRVGEPIRASVTYRAPTDLPLIGPLVPDLELEASAVMRIER